MALLTLGRDVFDDSDEVHDPAEAVNFTRKATPGQKARRPFTVQEIDKILAACDQEWRGLVVFALHTGQRLGDLAPLTWGNVDEAHGSLHLTTRKTRDRITIPLLPEPAGSYPFHRAPCLRKR